MVTITDLRDRIGKVDVDAISQASIEATKGGMIKRQKDQLLLGSRADGTRIGKYRSPFYAILKHQMNPLPGYGFMDWKLTGKLHEEIFVDVQKDVFEINSSDEKAGPLIKRLGDPFGLNEDNQTDYVEEELRPEFMKEIKQVIGL